MQVVYVDLIPQKIKPLIKASQFDDKRQVRFRLTENGEDYTLSGTETVTVTIRKPDRNIVIITPNIAANNYIDVYFTEQACACFGMSFGEITIEDGNSKIGTCNFDLDVELSPAFGGIDSTSEIDNLTTQINAMVSAAVAAIAPAIIEEIAPLIIGDEYLTKSQIEENYYKKTEVFTKNQTFDSRPDLYYGTLLTGNTSVTINYGNDPYFDYRLFLPFTNEFGVYPSNIEVLHNEGGVTNGLRLTFSHAFDHDISVRVLSFGQNAQSGITQYTMHFVP